MKKILIIFTFFLLFTGCKSKEKEPVILSISCKTNISIEDNKINYKDILTFEDDNLTQVKSIRKIEYTEDKKSQYDAYLSSIMSAYNNIDGIEATIDENVLTIDFDIAKMQEEDLKNNDLNIKEKDKLIELYQEKGYTCN